MHDIYKNTVMLYKILMCSSHGALAMSIYGLQARKVIENLESFTAIRV